LIGTKLWNSDAEETNKGTEDELNRKSATI
jgi:hypothetical protein